MSPAVSIREGTFSSIHTRKHPMTTTLFRSIGIVLSLLLALSFLPGCATTSYVGHTDPVLIQLQRDLGDYAVPFTLHLDPKYNSTAYAELNSNRIYVSQQLLNDYRSGKYNYNHLLHIIAHECAHLSKTGKELALSGDPGSEQFADYYGLLMLEEMQHDGFNVDLYDSIKRFLIRDGKDISNGIHGDDSERYRALKAKLDDWERTKHLEPTAA